MDRAREAVQRPPESLLDAMQRVELSRDDTDLLRDYLLLRGEISHHRENPHDYEPPRGDLRREEIEEVMAYGKIRDPWPVIEAFRKSADQILRAASRFGLRLDVLSRPDGHEAGRKWFPALADRLHLGAVVAKCGSFCAHAEAFVKNLRVEDPAHHLSPAQLYPQEAPELVERYNRHLGLSLPQHVQTIHEHENQHEVPDRATRTHEHSRDDDLDLDL